MSDTHPDADEGDRSPEPHDLREELRRITAPRGPTSPTGSEESAGLREAWLAFGKLLEAAGPGVPDEAVLVDAIRAREARRQSGNSWSRAAVAVAGVAAAVIAAALIAPAFRSDRPTRRTEVATTRPSSIADATTRSSSPPVGLPLVALATTQSLATEIAWDDQMTGRLDPVRRSVRRLQSVPHRHAERLDGLRARISALQEDWSQNRL